MVFLSFFLHFFLPYYSGLCAFTLNKTGNARIPLTLGRVRVTVVAVEKQVLDTACVTVALVIQHAKDMRRIILSSVACPALQNFSTLSHK
jgi:hypothetical protein